VARSLDESLAPAEGSTAKVGEWERDQNAWNLPRGSQKPIDDGAVRLLRGRFEAQFDGAEAARAAARDARAVGFVVDVEQGATGWLSVARRHLPFPGDERDRYASRFQAIAAQHGGVLNRFVEEPPAREGKNEE